MAGSDGGGRDEGASPQRCTPRGPRERAARDLRFSQGIIDSLDASLCVLDGEGTIVAVNRAWREFAALQGGTEQRTGPGVNYLAICQEAAAQGEADAVRVAEGIRRVLADGQVGFEHLYRMGEDYFIVRIASLDTDEEGGATFGGDPSGRLRHQAHGGGHASGPGRGRAGQPGQVGIPLRHEP
ncbi:hypothetical protein [Ectothiorhodospira mobilis]|uniref:hypothetical protein n=1 Tax=Ectothiorhodospira mobilis TaxID=195064 RepID=UPI001EE90464|nr:hypothetical protein [Ectothiorhodospira mobilis]MCG5536065.1 hypothetical protein [Ectothiorhodospira mobilis]